jgi:hypothetical protein
MTRRQGRLFFITALAAFWAGVALTISACAEYLT